MKQASAGTRQCFGNVVERRSLTMNGSLIAIEAQGGNQRGRNCRVPFDCLHLVGHNLIRRAMALAGIASGACPWQVSFKGALQTFGAFPADALLNRVAGRLVRRPGGRDRNPRCWEPPGPIRTSTPQAPAQTLQVPSQATSQLQKPCCKNHLQKFKCHSSCVPFSSLFHPWSFCARDAVMHSIFAHDEIAVEVFGTSRWPTIKNPSSYCRRRDLCPAECTD